MIRLAPTNNIQFSQNDINNLGMSYDIRKEYALNNCYITIPSTRLNQICLKINFLGNTQRIDDSIRVFYFKGSGRLGGGEQSEVIYLRRNQIKYVSSENEYWLGYPFYVTFIAFCPENISSDMNLTIDVFKL